jgi:hypothetical protein
MLFTHPIFPEEGKREAIGGELGVRQLLIISVIIRMDDPLYQTLIDTKSFGRRPPNSGAIRQSPIWYKRKC